MVPIRVMAVKDFLEDQLEKITIIVAGINDLHVST